MRITKFVLTGLTVAASLGLGSAALANGRNPGSLLIYPEFDNRVGSVTLLTITNTNTGIGNPGDADGTIKVEFVYIGKFNHNSNPIPCLEFNRTETLTANDTLTVATYYHNPQHERGYVYAFAKNKTTGKAMSFNYLIGNLLVIDGGILIQYSMNPVTFSAVPPFGANTDLESGGVGDGIRDLDGVEYEKVTSEILIPRFLGWEDQTPPFSSPELILIALSGGTAFSTLVDFLVYNDNEEAFSAQYVFNCWERVPLTDISAVFTRSFLLTTNHAANEIYLGPGISNDAIESGWMRINGNAAWSTAEQIFDPAVYAVLIENIAGNAGSDLPFESTLLQANGDLLPRGVFGDPSGTNSDNQ